METLKALVRANITFALALIFSLSAYAGDQSESVEGSCAIALSQGAGDLGGNGRWPMRRRGDQSLSASLESQYEELLSSPDVKAGLKEIQNLVAQSGSLLPGLNMATEDFFRVAAWDSTFVNKLVRIIRKEEQKGYQPGSSKNLVLGLKALIRVSELALEQAYNRQDPEEEDVNRGFFRDGSYAVRWDTEETLKGDQYATIDYTVPIVLFGEGVTVWQRLQGSVDRLTGVIDANSGGGVKMLSDFIHMARMDSEPWYYMFVDLDNLGLVNYFRRGQVAGDEYIRALRDSFKKVFRRSDQIFRVGGDEWVILVRGLSPQEVKNLAGRLIDDFYHSSVANKVFTEQWEYTEEALAEIRQAESWDAVSASSQALSSGDQELLDLAESNFSAFKKDFLAAKETELRRLRYLLKPTLSVGSTRVRKEDDEESLKDRGSINANEAKRWMKTQLGQDAKKYGGPGEDTDKIDRNIKDGVVILPKVAMPDEFSESE